MSGAGRSLLTLRVPWAAMPEGRHLLLYDGVCGLCDRLTRFVAARDRKDIFRFASLQGGTGRAWATRFGRDPDALDTFLLVVDYEGPAPRLLSRAEAGLFLLDRLGGVWRGARVLRILPGRLLDWGYDRVARSRYRVFGKHDQCALPSPALRAKLLDL